MVNNLLLYGTPAMANPTKVYILMAQEPTEKMLKKWIKAIFTKPLTILKSMWFNILGINQDLSIKRLNICRKCSAKLNTSLGEVCRECGCILENKTRVDNEHCDLGKW